MDLNLRDLDLDKGKMGLDNCLVSHNEDGKDEKSKKQKREVIIADSGITEKDDLGTLGQVNVLLHTDRR